MISRITAPLYVPASWESLPQSTKHQLLQLDRDLRNCLMRGEVRYQELEKFVFTCTSAVDIRNEVREVVTRRGTHAYSMTSEQCAVTRLAGEYPRLRKASLYSVAQELRALVFNGTEKMRDFDLTISFLPWLRLAPPKPADPIHMSLEEIGTGVAIFDAINIFLILVTAHAFTDGNGRTSRIFFNLYLRWRYPENWSYLPLAELCRMCDGMYEELLARANVSGGYTPVLEFLISLISSYCEFRSRQPQEVGPKDAIDEIEALIDNDPSARLFDLNRIAPFPLSLPDLAHGTAATKVDQAFVTALSDFALVLSEFGVIEFALTTLGILLSRDTERSVTLFVKAHRKEDLLLQFREIRRTANCIQNLELVVLTGEAVLDAKLLINISNFYAFNDGKRDALLILHDFPTSISRV